MQNIPNLIITLFILCTVFSIWQLYNASNKNRIVLILLLSWTILQGFIGLSGFYQNTQTIPPRFSLTLLPAIAFIIMLFFTRKGQVFLSSLSILKLTAIHIVRIPVEICLFYLFISRLIPQIMTFEGYNFDILSGISAIVIYYMVYINKINRTLLLVWNILCLLLLINIVTIAILSVPTSFQSFGFNQPNTAITYFPFIWLPSVIVPLVLLSHLATIRQLLLKSNHSAFDINHLIS